MSLTAAVVWTTAQFVTVLFIELAGLAVIARILTPTDFGVYAVAFALFLLGQFLGQFGLHTVIMRARTLDLAFRREVVSIILVASALVLIGFGTVLIWVPGVFPDPRPVAIALWMLPLVPVACFGMAAHAWIQRDMRFRTLFVLRVSTTLVFSVVAIPLAIIGWGPASLTVGLYASVATHAVAGNALIGGVFVVRPAWAGPGGSTRFASTVFTTTAFQQAETALVPYLVGRLIDLSTLGLFSRANEILRHSTRIAHETLLPVMQPYAFKVAREGQDLRPVCLNTLANVTALAWPVGVLIYVLADPLIAILLGPQWHEVPPILRLLMLDLLPFSLIATLRVFLLACQCEGLLMRISAVSAAATVAAVFVAAGYGILVMCMALVASHMVFALVTTVVALRKLDLTFNALLRALWPSGLVTLAVFACAYPIAQMSNGTFAGNAAVMVGALGAAALAWLGVVHLSGHPAGPPLRQLAGRVLMRRGAPK